jgi:hypothetical protein
MSQTPLTVINPATTNGAELASLLNQMWAALITGWSGPSRPSWAVEGTLYKNTSINALVSCGAASNGSQDVPVMSLALGGEDNALLFDENHIPQPVSLALFLSKLNLFTDASLPSTNGLRGLVPGPTPSQIGYVLKTGGWAPPDASRFVVQSVTDDVSLSTSALGRFIQIYAVNKTIELPSTSGLQNGDFISFEGRVAGTPRTVVVPKSGSGQTIDGGSTKTCFAFHSFKLVVSSGNWVTVDERTGTVRDINFQTTNYTFALTDAGRPVDMNSSSDRVFTIPANGNVPFEVGTQIDLSRSGTGEVAVTPDSGVTLVSENSFRRLANQHSMATLVKKATNTWLLGGSLKV